jgi:hypothetical protein
MKRLQLEPDEGPMSRYEIRDDKGNFRGSLTRESNGRLVERDQNGNVQGYYRDDGNKTIHRDKNGNTIGSIVRR